MNDDDPASADTPRYEPFEAALAVPAELDEESPTTRSVDASEVGPRRKKLDRFIAMLNATLLRFKERQLADRRAADRSDYAWKKARAGGGPVRTYRWHDHDDASYFLGAEECVRRHHLARQRSYRGKTEATTRPYTRLDGKTDDEKRERRRAQAAERQRRRRSKLKGEV